MQIQRFKTSFAEDIFRQKYSQGPEDSWDTLCDRLVNDICGDRSMTYKPNAAPLMSRDDQKQLAQYMKEMKMIAGGRYLYYAGRPAGFFNNCFCLKAEEDTREEWGNIVKRASDCLMSGGGIGCDYSILRPSGRTLSRTGGISSGPLPLMSSVNEIGRNVMQGGSRRSAIYASLNWQHEDIELFLRAKDWTVLQKQLKEEDFSFPLPLDMTNMSINWDTKFIEQVLEGHIPVSPTGEYRFTTAPQLWYDSVLKMCQTGEPGHSYNFWENENETLRNAPVTGNTRVLTRSGYVCVKDIIGTPTTLWTGYQWADNVIFKETNPSSKLVKVSLSNGRDIICSPEHPFIVKYYDNGVGRAGGVTYTRIQAVNLVEGDKIQNDVPTKHHYIDDALICSYSDDSYGLGFIFGDGSVRNQKLDVSYFVENKRECFNKTVSGLNMKLSLSRGGRAYGHTIFECKNDMLEAGIHNNPSFIAGWFDADGCYTRNSLRLSNKDKDILVKLAEALDLFGIKSIVRDDGKSSYKPENQMYTLQVLAESLVRFKRIIPTLRVKVDVLDSYKPYREHNFTVVSVEYLDYNQAVYCCDVKVSEHSFMAEGVIISNCTEFTSEDDSDVCNLGSINLGNIESLEELKSVTNLAAKFLVCGSIRGDLPYDKVREVRERNRKIGLGLMGVHEWLLQRNEKYEVTNELKGWLDVWRSESEAGANEWSDRFFINRPKKYRAIAPAGTIGILASTTTGIEPLYAVAYKRRYLQGGSTWKYQYVIDATAKRIIDEYSISPDEIETSSRLAADPERRIRFQYEIQKFVDMGISSTINLPDWGSDLNNEDTSRTLADTLLRYCHGLRGITTYPNGARGGQPLTEVPYEEAKKHHGIVFEEDEGKCKGGICGI